MAGRAGGAICLYPYVYLSLRHGRKGGDKHQAGSAARREGYPPQLDWLSVSVALSPAYGGAPPMYLAGQQGWLGGLVRGKGQVPMAICVPAGAVMVVVPAAVNGA